MAQTESYTIENGTGLNVRNKINEVFNALKTQNAGKQEPLETFAGMEWLDTSSSEKYLLKKRNMANDNWEVINEYDVSSKKFKEFLGKTEKASDSDKLDGLDSSKYLKKTDKVDWENIENKPAMEVSGFSKNQTRQNVTDDRNKNITYTNHGNSLMFINITVRHAGSGGSAGGEFLVNNEVLADFVINPNRTNQLSAIIKPNETYQLKSTYSQIFTKKWWEFN